MKKTTYLVVLFFAFLNFSYAQYTAVPDANFEQALIDAGIDTALDGQVLTASANAYTGGLSMINLDITDLTGIEAFTNLISLNISYNTGISNLDLSSCTALEVAKGTGCSELTLINVSGLIHLKELNFAFSELTTLDVSSNLALETLYIRGNNITSLDLSLHSLLTFLDVKHNNLSYLNVRNGNNANFTYCNSDYNVNLFCIYVDDMDVAYLEPPLWIKPIPAHYVNSLLDCATVSVDSVDEMSFIMYPNPTSASLYVSIKTNKAVFKVYNIMGKVVLSKDLVQGKNLIDVSNLGSGIYLAQFVSDYKMDTKKLIIK